EQHPTRAIDLKIDKPGHQHAARQHDPLGIGRNLAGTDDAAHRPVGGKKRPPLVPDLAVEDRHSRYRKRAHSVAVTLRRWGGLSGLKPRRRASASMKP